MSYLEMALKASRARQTAKEELETDRQTPAASTPAPAELVAPCGSPHCGGCYDVGDGRKIHPPKAGMNHAEPSAPPQRKVAVVCWHCQGEKTCNCIACYETGTCISCGGRGKVLRWIQ